MVTIRVHNARVFVEGEPPRTLQMSGAPHLVAVAYLPSGQVFGSGLIIAGHSPSVQSTAVAEMAGWVRKNRPGWDIETLPGEGVVGCNGGDGCPRRES